ncbi:MAG: hypothetical protein JWP74_3410 [Marmoricola sp.]|nr:hypothetical protein [Marmoricola sp.]
MSRDVSAPPPTEDRPPDPPGRIRPTGPGVLVIVWGVGLVLGWAARGQAIRDGSATPSIPTLAIVETWFVAAVTAGTAYLTWRAVHRERTPLIAHQAVARLVLGKTIARLGAFALGGFLGVAISNLGVGAENAPRIVVHALLAAAGAGAGLAAGLLLELACRIPGRGSGDLP